MFCGTAVQDVSLLSTGLVGLGFLFVFACLLLLYFFVMAMHPPQLQCHEKQLVACFQGQSRSDDSYFL